MPTSPLLATLPHRPPILLLTSIPIKDGDWFTTNVQIPKDALVVKSDGSIEEASFLEMMAQCFASAANLGAKADFGYLAQVKKFTIQKTVYAEKNLCIKTRPIFTFENIVVVEGIILDADTIVARAEFKVFHPGQNQLP